MSNAEIKNNSKIIDDNNPEFSKEIFFEVDSVINSEKSIYDIDFNEDLEIKAKKPIISNSLQDFKAFNEKLNREQNFLLKKINDSFHNIKSGNNNISSNFADINYSLKNSNYNKLHKDFNINYSNYYFNNYHLSHINTRINQSQNFQNNIDLDNPKPQQFANEINDSLLSGSNNLNNNINSNAPSLLNSYSMKNNKKIDIITALNLSKNSNPMNNNHSPNSYSQSILKGSLSLNTYKNNREKSKLSPESTITKNNFLSNKSIEKTNISMQEGDIISNINMQNILSQKNLNPTNINYNYDFEDKRFDTIYESCMELSDKSRILLNNSKLDSLINESIQEIDKNGNKKNQDSRGEDNFDENDNIKKFKNILSQTIENLNLMNNIYKNFENLKKIKVDAENKKTNKKHNMKNNNSNQSSAYKKGSGDNTNYNSKSPKDESFHISNIAEIQLLKIQDDKIIFTVLKFSHDGKYLAAGTESGNIYIFEIINLDFLTSKGIKPTDNNFHNCTYKLINENYIKYTDEHKMKIVDICWSYKNPWQFYSCSLDNTLKKFDLIRSNSRQENNIWPISEMYTSPQKQRNNNFNNSSNFQENKVTYFDDGRIMSSPRKLILNNNLIPSNNEISNCNSNINSDFCDKKILSLLTYLLSDYVVCFAVCPTLIDRQQERIVTFTFDKVFRLFVEEGKQLIPILNYDSNDIITTLSFSPDGLKLYLGDFKGKITKYTHTKEGLEFEAYFTCKNKYGKFSNGRKVTNIEFINNNLAYISTTDSRIRLVNMINGETLVKYKGHTNLNMKSFIKGHSDDFNNVIISASEDNYIYIWKKVKTRKNKIIKIYDYEKFMPLRDSNLLDTYCLNEICFNDYLMKFCSFYDKILLKSVFLNTSDKGEIQVLINYEKIDKQIIENIRSKLTK